MGEGQGSSTPADSHGAAVTVAFPRSASPVADAMVALVFPPGTDPRSPHLALPALASSLRAAGVETIVRDLDVMAPEHVLQPERLAEALTICEARRRAAPAGSDEHRRLRGLLRHRDALTSGMAGAFATLRGEGFYDPPAHHYARALIERGLEVISTANGRVDYGISPPRYDVDGFDPTVLADLVAATADPATDLFAGLHATFVAEVDELRPTIVGLSITNRQQVIPGLRLARMLHDAGHFTVIGGTVYAKFAAELAERPGFFEVFCDAVVPYEGEPALLALAEHLARGGARHDLHAIPNVLWRDGAEVVAGPTVVEDVRGLPTPDFDGLPLEKYLAPEPVLPILLGKGCYYNRCSFCDIPFINQVSPRAYRTRSPEQVVADVVRLQERYGARHFEVTDETLSPHALRSLAHALERNAPGLDARFVGYARFEPGFTPELCQTIYAAGFRKLFFGLESGSQHMVDHMKKGFRIETARRVLRNCVEAGIAVHVFSIVGFPEETEELADETLRLLVEQAELLAHPACTFDVHRFGLDLRTEYGDRPDRYGVIVDTDDLARRDFPITVERWDNTRGLSAAEADELIDRYLTVLRTVHAPERQVPDQQWPGFEEYAVLYARHYENRPFGYPLGLPDEGTAERIELRVHPDTVWEPLGDDHGNGRPCLVGTIAGETVVGGALLPLLARLPGPGPTAGVLDELMAHLSHTADQREELRAELRSALDRLIAARVVTVETETVSP